MLAPAYEENPVQAFPISKLTVVGMFTNQSTANRSTLRAIEASSVTYTFDDNTTFTENLGAGEDRGLTRDIRTVTTTSNCMIS